MVDLYAIMPVVHVVVFGAVALVPEWRRTALIIAVFALANIGYQDWLDTIAATGNKDVIAIHAMIDAITLFVVLNWGSKGMFTARNIFWKSGGARFLQASVLTLFMTWNLALLLDYKSSPYPIYESYSQVIFALNLIQILLISGGIYAVANLVLERARRPVLGRERNLNYYIGADNNSRSGNKDEVS